MKKVFSVFILIALFYLEGSSQIDPWLIIGDESYKKNNKMEYDGVNKFLFFYEDTILIKDKWKGKNRLQLKALNDSIKIILIINIKTTRYF